MPKLNFHLVDSNEQHIHDGNTVIKDRTTFDEASIVKIMEKDIRSLWKELREYNQQSTADWEDAKRLAEQTKSNVASTSTFMLSPLPAPASIKRDRTCDRVSEEDRVSILTEANDAEGLTWIETPQRPSFGSRTSVETLPRPVSAPFQYSRRPSAPGLDDLVFPPLKHPRIAYPWPTGEVIDLDSDPSHTLSEKTEPREMLLHISTHTRSISQISTPQTRDKDSKQLPEFISKASEWIMGERMKLEGIAQDIEALENEKKDVEAKIEVLKDEKIGVENRIEERRKEYNQTGALIKIQEEIEERFKMAM